MVRITAITVATLLVLAACAAGAAEPDTSTGEQTTTGGETPPASRSATTAAASPSDQPAESAVAWPDERIHATLLHDAFSGRLLMMSGMSAMQRHVDLREVWSLDTTDFSWRHLGDVAPLDALITFGADTESGQVIALNMSPVQTWSYDLNTGEWAKGEPAAQPESTSTNPRFGAPLTYDAESDRLVLFAGGSPWFMYADTWAYDANTGTWEHMNPATSPSPRAMYATAYDAESDRVLLWGGFTGTDENDVHMWAYDYNSDTWEALENVDGPQQHWERHGMAYIPEIDRVLFYSGMLEEEGVLPSETWYYDYNTNTWTEIDVSTSPPDLAMYAMTWDPETEKVVMFGGEHTSKYAGDLSRDVWVFDPSTNDWSSVAAPVAGG